MTQALKTHLTICLPLLPGSVVLFSRQETLTKLHISSEGTIERDGLGMLQVGSAA